MTIINSSSFFGVSKFVVGSSLGTASYLTIASAVADIVLAGGEQTLWIQPGTYTENISWPKGLSVKSTSSAETSLQVVLIGSQDFSPTTDGHISFEGISFQNTATAIWNTPAGIAIANVDLINCHVFSSGNYAIQSVTALGTCQMTIRNCHVSSAGIEAALFSGGLHQLFGSTFQSLASRAVEIGAGGDVRPVNCKFIANAAFSAVQITDSSAIIASYNSYYNGSDAINFVGAGGAVSIFDTFQTTAPYFVNASTAGSLSIGSPVFVTGSSQIDPLVTVNLFPSFPIPVVGFPWTSISANQGLLVNNGYFVSSGALLLALPTTSLVGEVIEVSLLATGTSFKITQGVGQSVRIGSNSSTVGVLGYIESSAIGDSVKLVCSVANLEWVTQSVQGSITVV